MLLFVAISLLSIFYPLRNACMQMKPTDPSTRCACPAVADTPEATFFTYCPKDEFCYQPVRNKCSIKCDGEDSLIDYDEDDKATGFDRTVDPLVCKANQMWTPASSRTALMCATPVAGLSRTPSPSTAASADCPPLRELPASRLPGNSGAKFGAIRYKYEEAFKGYNAVCEDGVIFTSNNGGSPKRTVDNYVFCEAGKGWRNLDTNEPVTQATCCTNADVVCAACQENGIDMLPLDDNKLKMVTTGNLCFAECVNPNYVVSYTVDDIRGQTKAVRCLPNLAVPVKGAGKYKKPKNLQCGPAGNCKCPAVVDTDETQFYVYCPERWFCYQPVITTCEIRCKSGERLFDYDESSQDYLKEVKGPLKCSANTWAPVAKRQSLYCAVDPITLPITPTPFAPDCPPLMAINPNLLPATLGADYGDLVYQYEEYFNGYNAVCKNGIIYTSNSGSPPIRAETNYVFCERGVGWMNLETGQRINQVQGCNVCDECGSRMQTLLRKGIKGKRLNNHKFKMVSTGNLCFAECADPAYVVSYTVDGKKKQTKAVRCLPNLVVPSSGLGKYKEPTNLQCGPAGICTCPAVVDTVETQFYVYCPERWFCYQPVITTCEIRCKSDDRLLDYDESGHDYLKEVKGPLKCSANKWAPVAKRQSLYCAVDPATLPATPTPAAADCPPLTAINPNLLPATVGPNFGDLCYQYEEYYNGYNAVCKTGVIYTSNSGSPPIRAETNYVFCERGVGWMNLETGQRINQATCATNAAAVCSPCSENGINGKRLNNHKFKMVSTGNICFAECADPAYVVSYTVDGLKKQTKAVRCLPNLVVPLPGLGKYKEPTNLQCGPAGTCMCPAVADTVETDFYVYCPEGWFCYQPVITTCQIRCKAGDRFFDYDEASPNFVKQVQGPLACGANNVWSPAAKRQSLYCAADPATLPSTPTPAAADCPPLQQLSAANLPPGSVANYADLCYQYEEYYNGYNAVCKNGIIYTSNAGTTPTPAVKNYVFCERGVRWRNLESQQTITQATCVTDPAVACSSCRMMGFGGRPLDLAVFKMVIKGNRCFAECANTAQMISYTAAGSRKTTKSIVCLPFLTVPAPGLTKMAPTTMTCV